MLLPKMLTRAPYNFTSPSAWDVWARNLHDIWAPQIDGDPAVNDLFNVTFCQVR